MCLVINFDRIIVWVPVLPRNNSKERDLLLQFNLQLLPLANSPKNPNKMSNHQIHRSIVPIDIQLYIFVSTPNAKIVL